MMPKVNPPNAHPSSPTVLMMTPTPPTPPPAPPDVPVAAPARPDMGGGGRAAEEIPQCRLQHQRIEPEIGGVERPTRPNHEENQPLISADSAREAETGFADAAALHGVSPHRVLPPRLDARLFFDPASIDPGRLCCPSCTGAPAALSAPG